MTAPALSAAIDRLTHAVDDAEQVIIRLEAAPLGGDPALRRAVEAAIAELDEMLGRGRG